MNPVEKCTACGFSADMYLVSVFDSVLTVGRVAVLKYLVVVFLVFRGSRVKLWFFFFLQHLVLKRQRSEQRTSFCVCLLIHFMIMCCYAALHCIFFYLPYFTLLLFSFHSSYVIYLFIFHFGIKHLNILMFKLHQISATHPYYYWHCLYNYYLFYPILIFILFYFLLKNNCVYIFMIFFTLSICFYVT